MLAAAQFQQWCLRLHLEPSASEAVTRVRSSPPARRVGSRANNVSGTYASRWLLPWIKTQVRISTRSATEYTLFSSARLKFLSSIADSWECGSLFW
jgi:hypothetical protein